MSTDDLNPYASPAVSTMAGVRRSGDRVLDALAEAWELFTRHVLVIAAAVMAVWTPLELFSSYMDYYVFDPDDFRSSFKLAQFLDNFFGIIATAAVISVGANAAAGKSSTIFGALGAGLSAWPRIWWTRLLYRLAVFFGLLLLVVPGIYVAIRLCLAENVAVVEHVSGTTALSRSFELTRGRFWFLVRLYVATGLLFLLLIIMVIIPVVAVPVLDHWVVDAASQLVGDVVVAYGTLCFFCVYRNLSSLPLDANAENGGD
jgi:hypothetical protein